MKYEVRVGEEFDLGEVPAKSGNGITVHVSIGSPANEKKGLSAKQVAALAAVVLAVVVVTPAVAYGTATGDFSFLKALAKSFNELASVIVKFAVSALNSK